LLQLVLTRACLASYLDRTFGHPYCGRTEIFLAYLRRPLFGGYSSKGMHNCTVWSDKDRQVAFWAPVHWTWAWALLLAGNAPASVTKIPGKESSSGYDSSVYGTII